MANPAPPNDDSWVAVKTTLPVTPFPPNTERQAVHTERLTLRPAVPEDLAALHELRTQPDVMKWTMTGKVDADMGQSEEKLRPFLPPRDVETWNYCILWRETGRLVGIGGCHRFEGSYGWPELGYMLRQDFWGKGLATEFLRAYLGIYWGLPRQQVEVKVKRCSVPELRDDGGGGGGGDGGLQEVPEVVTVLIEASNAGSLGVSGKAGFEKFAEYTEERPDGTVDRLVGLRHFGSKARE